MVRGLFLVAVLAGCGFSLTGELADGGSDDADATDATQVDAAVDAAPKPDTDLDGIPDDVDNCPQAANLDQHDEDGDLIGDGCDPCPQDAVATADGDGDGVGDRCDPHPATPGDQLVRFESFAIAPPGGALPAGWLANTATTDWTIANDDLTIDVSVTGSAHFIQLDAAAPHTRIDLGFDVGTAGTVSPMVTGIVDEDANNSAGWSCSTRFGVSLPLQSFSGGSFTDRALGSGIPTAPGTFRIVTTIDGGGVACAITTSAGTVTPTFGGSSANRTRVGIRVRDVTARIHYVAVYASP